MFLADLHIHSRFSRATSKDLTPQSLDAWARLKGLDVVGCGDFTHPQWRQELREQLVQDPESGLYTLKTPPTTLPFVSENAAAMHAKKTFFCLQCEISSIYKKNGRVRKIHNLIYVPTLEDAERFSKRLEKVGNLASDGRPILGLDAKDLLEILLETVPEGICIPAHIWTPWFSLFGSQSGFDSITECFEDLTPHIFALETGLSSDPPMNRYISALDGFALVSNSDAHSPNKLGREANVFEGTPSYSGIFQAIAASAKRSADQEKLPCRFLGTIEFFPEEGKYHLDGHRNCNVSFNPLETRSNNFLCPVCHKPVTIGVLHRVMDLADRSEPAQLPEEPVFRSIMPLLEMTAELLGYGVGSNAVLQEYGRILSKLGSELDVLCSIPLDTITAYWDLLGEACRRLREGQVLLEGGYDGAFGTVHLFEPHELEASQKKHRKRSSQRKQSQASLANTSKASLKDLSLFKDLADNQRPRQTNSQTPSYSDEQMQAMHEACTPTLVLAGPGSGKTHLLMGRIAHLREDLPAKRICAITFTRQAAMEMRNRLAQRTVGEQPVVTTMHGLAWELVRASNPSAILLPEDVSLRLFTTANNLKSHEAKNLWQQCSRLREQKTLEQSACFSYYTTYLQEKERVFSGHAVDFGELLSLAQAQLDLMHAQGIRPFDALLVDEIQDCSPANLDFLHAITPDGAGFFAIGDPDQAIYGFRGSVSDIVGSLKRFWPNLTMHRLQHTFRSAPLIVETAQGLLGSPATGSLHPVRKAPAELKLIETPHQKSETRFLCSTIAMLLGATSHTFLDCQPKTSSFAGAFSPNDIAVLARYRFVLRPIAQALRGAGIPCVSEEEEAFWNDTQVAMVLDQIWHVLQTEDNTTPYTKETLPDPLALIPWLESQPALGYGIGTNPAYRACAQFWQTVGSWDTFFDELALRKKEVALLGQSEGVRLLTLHAAKGLEFPCVFLPAFEEGILPTTSATQALFGMHNNDAKEADRVLEEERRLCYVGITRASDCLFVSYAKSRYIFGKMYHFPPSSFLPAIDHFFAKTQLREKTVAVYKDGSLI
ncbi:MAG: UvrD-helicase domain-containing protein [Desulfovibrio sp.]|nr:UvrD-helicase domain-containing protein [Desulfovibrio sp.]